MLNRCRLTFIVAVESDSVRVMLTCKFSHLLYCPQLKTVSYFSSSVKAIIQPHLSEITCTESAILISPQFSLNSLTKMYS